jgi:hypothetical protein
MNLTILLQWTHSFATVTLAIFATTLNYFSAATVSVFLVLQCSVIPRCYNGQSFLFDIVLTYLSCYNTQSFSLLQCSVIPHATMLSYSSLVKCSVIFQCKKVLNHSSCYSVQSFLFATILNHSLLLQRARDAQVHGSIPCGVAGLGVLDSVGGWTVGYRW